MSLCHQQTPELYFDAAGIYFIISMKEELCALDQRWFACNTLLLHEADDVSASEKLEIYTCKKCLNNENVRGVVCF